MTVFIMTGITRRQAKHIQNGLVRIKEAYHKVILHGAATLLTPPPPPTSGLYPRLGLIPRL